MSKPQTLDPNSLKARAEVPEPWQVLLSAGLLNYLRFIEARFREKG